MPTLLVLKGPLKGEEFKLSDGLNIIGRHATYCDIVLAHDAVSRRHAVIEVSKPGCYIEDMHSHNGTAVNGRRLAPGEAGRMELCDADLVEINGFQLIFYRNESTASTVLLVADEDGESSHSIVSSVQVQAQLDDSTLEYPTAKLRALLRVMDDLGNSVKADDVPQRTLLSLMGSFEQAQRGFILLREPSGDEFRAAAAMHRDGSTRRIRMSRTIVESVVRRRSAILTADATQDQRFSDSHSVSKMQLRSMMCAPLISRDGDVFGVIQLDASDGAARFLHPDLEVLAGIARHVGAVLENARLHDAALSAQKMRFERQFRNLVVGSIQGILIQREFRPLFVNDSWALYHGLGPGEVTRMESVLPLVHPDDVALVREHVLRLARGEAESAMFEYRGLRADRMPVWFENVMTAVEWNELPAIQSVIIDVTVRKEAELALKRAHGELEQRVAQRTADLSATNLKLQDEIHERTLAENNLRRSETLYQSLVETLPLGVARKDLEGRYTFANEGLAKLLKLAVGDIVGRTDEQLFSRVVADKHRRDDQTVVEFGSAMDFIERVDLPEAPARYLHTIRSPIRDTNGDVVAVQVIVSDITQLKQTEQELILYSEELERSNRELSQFASVVSHDLTAPLRAITSYGQLLVRRYQGKLDDEADEFIGYIVGGASRMQTLINDLRACASDDDGRSRRCRPM
ncbi:MAG: PAS domain S-box protein [Pirellulaceae bacterium]